MTSNHLPFASIIIPVYNGEKTIKKCIESLLNQDYPQDKYEIIVVDNNSQDQTKQIAKQYPITYVLEDKVQSSYAARNKGAQIAAGEALVFFDDDQIAKSNWLKELLKGWDEEKFAAFGGKRVAVASKNNVAGAYWQQTSSAKIPKLFCEIKDRDFFKVSCGNVVYRRDTFEKLGGFDPELFSLGDYDLALRVQKELGYTIRYNFEAIVYHNGRANWNSLLNAEFRMGFGRYLFERKHAECKTSLLRELLEVLKRTILGLGATIIGIFEIAQGKNKREHLLIILLDMAMFWSRLLGRIQGIITGGRRIFPAHW